jgi:hypothetical protein
MSSLNRSTIVGFEVLTAVVMKSTIFWDIMPRIPLKVNRRFGGTYSLYLQGREISRLETTGKAGGKKLVTLDGLTTHLSIK